MEQTSRIQQQKFDIYKNSKGVVSMEIPLNLYFVGTINMDESTHPLSSKVLDRANVIEMNYVSRDILTKKEGQNEGKKVNGIDAFFAQIKSLPSIHSAMSLKETNEDLVNVLYDINDGLIPLRTNMGHRSIFEIAHYINLYTKICGHEYGIDALDAQLCQKLIPKITGVDERVEQSILHIAKILTANAISGEEGLLTIDFSNFDYPRTLRKLHKMYKYFKQNGFVNFANI